MKLILATIFALPLLFTNIASAQLPPDYNGKTLASSTTIDGFSLNFEPVFNLLTVLEAKGAKVQTKLLEINGQHQLLINVDGKNLKPIMLFQRTDREIVYEY